MLLFYRSLGLGQDSINRLVDNGLQGHRLAMKRAIAHTLAGRMQHAEMVDLIGPVPGLKEA